MNNNYLMKMKNVKDQVVHVVFSFKIYLSFSFCSEFNLEATVVKADEIRGLIKQLLTTCFFLIGIFFFPK